MPLNINRKEDVEKRECRIIYHESAFKAINLKAIYSVELLSYYYNQT